MSYAENPPTEKKPVTDEYHGVKVVDDYRWLEDAGTPAVKAWTDAQNRRTPRVPGCVGRIAPASRRN
ncbi:MAG: hypothetical protein WDN28_26720 [Chthoniobacter sp.]